MITLLDAVKMAYRKHVMDDPNIGWEQLSETLFAALYNEMGDAEYQKWLLSTRERLFWKMTTNGLPTRTELANDYADALLAKKRAKQESGRTLRGADGALLCDCGEPFPESGRCKFCGVVANAPRRTR